MNARLTWGIVIAAAAVVVAVVLGLLFGLLTAFLMAGVFIAAVVIVNAGRMRSRGAGRPSRHLDDGSWASRREE